MWLIGLAAWYLVYESCNETATRLWNAGGISATNGTTGCVFGADCP